MSLRKHDAEVQLYAFDLLALDGADLHRLPLSMRKTNLAQLLARRPDGIFIAPFEQGEIGPDLFRAACDMGLEGLVSKRRRPSLSGRQIEALGEDQEPKASRNEPSDGDFRIAPIRNGRWQRRRFCVRGRDRPINIFG